MVASPPALGAPVNCKQCKSEITQANRSSNGHGGAKSVCRICYNNGRPSQSARAIAKKWPSVAAFDRDKWGPAIVDAEIGDAQRAQHTCTDPKTTDYCQACGESPDSGSHLPHGHEYAPPKAPRIEVVEETITRVEEHRLKRKVKDLESELADLTAKLSDGGEFAEVVEEVLAHQGESDAPKIAPREARSKLSEATPLVLASDWHVEHEVRPEQVAGRNRYNLEISGRRMERFFEATRWAINHQRQVPFKIRDLVLWLGGDFIQNYLHEDDNESNLLSPTNAILYAQESITRGIDYLLADPEIEQFVFPCNDGNHGRLTKKMRSSTRIENSLEVFLYAQLASHYRHEPRVKFLLPTSQFTFLKDVYGHTIRFLHGDVFKFNGGVGGITVPMLRSQARWETVQHASLTCLGHWHQRICLPNLMVNASLIGYDPFAMGIGASFEPPSQSLRMLVPGRFCSSDIPLYVSERADDDQYRE